MTARLFAIRRDGAYLKRGLKPSWTKNLPEIRFYARQRDARQRISLMQQQAEEPMEGAEIVEFALLGPVGTTKPRRRGLP